MSKHTFILIAAFFFKLVSACKNSDKSESTSKTAAETVIASGPIVPGIPGELMSKLLNECTGIDYVFHNMPFSLNQDEKPSIIQNIGFIDINRPVGSIPADCKPIGRKFYKINADVTYDADVYLSGKCRFYVFVGKDNKPMYANYMTDAAVQFYANTAQQAKQSLR